MRVRVGVRVRVRVGVRVRVRVRVRAAGVTLTSNSIWERYRGDIAEIHGRYRGDMSVTFASKPSRSLLHGPSGHCPRNVRSITSTRAEANLGDIGRYKEM